MGSRGSRGGGDGEGGGGWVSEVNDAVAVRSEGGRKIRARAHLSVPPRRGLLAEHLRVRARPLPRVVVVAVVAARERRDGAAEGLRLGLLLRRGVQAVLQRRLHGRVPEVEPAHRARRRRVRRATPPEARARVLSLTGEKRRECSTHSTGVVSLSVIVDDLIDDPRRVVAANRCCHSLARRSPPSPRRRRPWARA